MLAKGHTGIAMLLYAPVGIIISEFISLPLAVLCGVYTIAGAGLPDIDSSVSIVKHRGFTHTLWFVILAGVVSAGVHLYIPSVLNIQDIISVPPIFGVIIGVSTSYGVITHLVGDMITPRGIRPLTPIFPRDLIPSPFSDRKIKYEITKASSDFYNNFFMAIGSLLLAVSIGVSQANILPI